MQREEAAMKVERRRYTAKNGKVHETINVCRAHDHFIWLSLDTPEEAEQVGRDLIRVAAEWRQERAKE
jgi:hypothetical protein